MARYAFIAGTALVALFIVYVAKAYALYRARVKFAKDNGCEPPTSYPHKIPFFGIDFTLKFKNAWDSHRLLDMVEEEHRKLGKTIRFVQFGNEVFSTMDPANLKSVIYTNFDSYCIEPVRRIQMEPLLGLGMLNCDGEIWKHSRNLTRIPLSKSEAGNLSLIDGHLERMLSMIPRDGSTVDMKSMFDHMITDFSTEYLFGESIDSQGTDRAIELVNLERDVSYALGEGVKRQMLGDIVRYMPANKKFLKAAASMHAFIDKQIYKALHRKRSTVEKGDRRIYIDDVLDETTDYAQIRSDVVTLYSAATETTAFTLSNMVFYLSRNHRVLERLREEVEGLGPGKPTAASLLKLPYLKAVINETLRIRHIASFTNRVAAVDTLLPTGGGANGKSPIFVKKGSIIIWPFTAQFRDKSVWGDDAHEFRPERFLEKDPEPWTFMPFGGGRRICPGQMFALTNVRYTIVRFLQEFKDIESRDDRPWTEEQTLAVSNKNGTLVGLTPA